MDDVFKPLVSIIIPVYNGSDYLVQAINSALCQTYDNIEIIVVNDGSNDGGKTEKIALSYGKKIKYFSKPNGGVSSALNFGIEKMQGEYFSWLSHDDLYEPEKIQYEVDLIKNVEDRFNTIVCCADNLINAQGDLIYHPSLRLSGLYSGKDMFLIFFRKHLIINGCTLLIHKSIFSRFGGFSSFKYIQDTECWINFMLNGVAFLYTKRALVKMRVHPNQVTMRFPDLYYTEMNLFCNRIIDEYIIPAKIDKCCIDAFWAYQYRKNNKLIYEKLEQIYPNYHFYFKAYWMMKGVLFRLVRDIYKRLFKK